LQEVDGKARIWLVDPQSQTVSPREVKILERSADSVLVANGIKPGDRVVSAGVNSLQPGQKVKLDEDAR
jgi:multidrug efflux pump subunit AcrA (membrane-fusion protein)